MYCLLSLNEATKIPKSDLNFFISKPDVLPYFEKDLQIIASDNPFNALVNFDFGQIIKTIF